MPNLMSMKNPLLSLILIIVVSLSLVISSSCKKISEDITAANALVGLWRPGGTSVEIKVSEVDIIEYLMSNFGYSEEEAKDIWDDIIEDVLDLNLESITFYGDKIYHEIRTDKSEEEGLWSVSADGKILTLYFEDEEDNLTILEQTSSKLTLQLPTIYEDIDFDDDGVNESVVEIIVEQNLSKTSKGGMGQ